MQKLFFLVVGVLTPFCFAAVEVDDNYVIRESSSSSYKVESQGLAFKRERKIGLGISTAGALGLVGINAEINFTPQTSFMGGFGVGDSYQSFALQMKHSIGGRWFVPYVGAGYARWFTVGESDGRINETSPGFLAERFLDDGERSSGQFSENLIYPMGGVQYFQLRGKYTGLSLYAQVMMLLDIDQFNSAPTGEFGVFYYF